MNVRTARRTAASAGGILLAAGILLAPTAALAAPEEGTGACTVTGGTLSWGVKESFRSYISGSIANGSWEPSEGATYETPEFQWGGATGEIDPETGSGTVSFTGIVHFTGHGGVLDLTLANPTIEFEGDGKAALMLDTRSTDAQGEVSIDTAQEWVGEVTAPAELAPSDSQLQLDAMTTVLTNSGAKAFAGFYEGGVELDPVTVALEFESCEASAAAPEEPTAPAEPVETAEPEQVAEQGVPWLPIIIGGVAILVIGVTGGMLIAGRGKKQPAAERETDGSSSPEA